MRSIFLGFAATAATIVCSTASAQQTGTLKARFVFGGMPPAAEPIDPNTDAQFCGKHNLSDESLVVNKENNGIRNVVLYVHTGRGGSKLPKMELANKTHELANDKCRFDPHIVLARAGDTLKVTNPDPVGHNANISFFRNDAVNFTVPPGGEKSVELTAAEPGPIPAVCNIHTWMRAYVVVLDHPYAAVSDEDGTVMIEGLPAGENLTFRIYQEAAKKMDAVKINGELVKLKSSRLDIKIQPGMNDLGDIEIPEAAFQ